MSNLSTNGAVNEILDKLPASPFDPAVIENSLSNIDSNTANTHSQEVINGAKLDTVNAHLQNIETTQGGQYSEDILSRVALQNIDAGIDNIEVSTNGTYGATVSIDSKTTLTNNALTTIANQQLNQATAAKQDTAQTSLTSIDSKLTTLSGAVSNAAMQVVSRTLVEEIQMKALLSGKQAYVFHCLGRRAGFTSTSVWNDIKEFDNSVAESPNLSNSNLEIISSSASDDGSPAGTGVRTVKVVYVNNSGALVQSADITLNGTTAVANVLTGVNEVLWMEATSVGSANAAVGNIRLRLNGTTTEVEQISAGLTKSRSARALIPTGYTGYIGGWDATSIGTTQDLQFQAQTNSFDNSVSTVYSALDYLYLPANTSNSGEQLMFKIPAGAKVKISTLAGNTNASNRADVSFTLILIQN